MTHDFTDETDTGRTAAGIAITIIVIAAVAFVGLMTWVGWMA